MLKERDETFLTYINNHYIKPYFIKDNDVVLTTDKFKEKYPKIEAARIKEQEFKDILIILDKITQDNMDVYAIITHFKRANKYKEDPDKFKIYATVLLDSLRLINENYVIDDDELIKIEDLEKLKSVEYNSAFLSSIFNTYINPHLVDDNGKYKFKDLSKKIEELRIKRDKADKIFTDYEHAINKEITQKHKNIIQRELQLEQQEKQEKRTLANLSGLENLRHHTDYLH